MVAERHRTGWDHAGPQKRQLCKAKARLLHPKSSSRHTLDRPMGKGGERYAIRDKNDLVSLSTLARFLGGAIPRERVRKLAAGRRSVRRRRRARARARW